MLNFHLRGSRYEDVGGIAWTFKKLLSGSLFAEEGIWIPTRVVVFQAAQVVVASFLSFASFLLVRLSAEAAAEAQESLDKDTLPEWVVA